LHKFPVYQAAGEYDDIGVTQESRAADCDKIGRSWPGAYK
jgi:hypothetical protein